MRDVKVLEIHATKFRSFIKGWDVMPATDNNTTLHRVEGPIQESFQVVYI